MRAGGRHRPYPYTRAVEAEKYKWPQNCQTIEFLHFWKVKKFAGLPTSLALFPFRLAVRRRTFLRPYPYTVVGRTVTFRPYPYVPTRTPRGTALQFVPTSLRV